MQTRRARTTGAANVESAKMYYALSERHLVIAIRGERRCIRRGAAHMFVVF
jgi:hypothetical protein